MLLQAANSHASSITGVFVFACRFGVVSERRFRVIPFLPPCLEVWLPCARGVGEILCEFARKRLPLRPIPGFWHPWQQQPSRPWTYNSPRWFQSLAKSCEDVLHGATILYSWGLRTETNGLCFWMEVTEIVGFDAIPAFVLKTPSSQR